MKKSYFYRLFLAVMIFTLALVGFPMRSAQAASLVVTTTADDTVSDGQCSLREAIANANSNNVENTDCAAGSGLDEITFNITGTTITLGSTLPVVRDSAGLQIDGNGNIVLSGGGAVRVLQVKAGASLTLTGITISDGRMTSGSEQFGGGVYNRGNLIVRNSRFSNNAATFGGAILSYGGSTVISTTSFVNNFALDGGGTVLFTDSGSHSISDSLFNSNVAYNEVNQHGSGGGLQTENGTTVNVTNTTFYNNQANGASDDGGGGLMVYGGTVTVVNSTFVENRAATLGGGIRWKGGTVTLRNTIVSNSVTGSNCYGTVTDGGGNLVWGDTTCPGLNANPQHQALANNGGPTQTMALGSGSAAINQAVASYCPTTDQRGQNRRSSYCDIGAFESQPASVSAVNGTPQNSVCDYPFAQPLDAAVRDDYNNLLAGAVVDYSPPASGTSAVLSSLSATTGISGTASVTATANSITGTYTVTATSGDATPASFELTNTPGAADYLEVTGYPTPVTAGESYTFTVTVRDEFGNLVTDYAGSVTFASDDARAILPGDFTFTPADAGQHTFSATFKTAGTNRYLRATDTILSSVTGEQSGIEVVRADPAKLVVVSGSPQSAQVGTDFFILLKVRVSDTYDNPVSGAVVTFTVSAASASATLTGTNPDTTDSDGEASISATANTMTGSYEVKAATNAPGVLTEVKFVLTNLAGPASSLTYDSGSPQTAQVSQPFALPLVVIARDAYGNPVPGASVTYNLLSSGLAGCTFDSGSSLVLTGSDGRASITVTANPNTGSYTVESRVNGVIAPVVFNLTNKMTIFLPLVFR